MGTGFIKCIPITLPGLPVKEAKAVIDIDEVLEAKMHSLPVNLSS
jgi:hypothetical protein